MKNKNDIELLDLKKYLLQLHNTIDDLNKKLKDSESMKSNFISNVMNEIYNPFSSIISLSQNITGLKDTDLFKARTMANTIYEEASTLDIDLKNIFAAARIESGLEIPNFKQADINVLLDQVIETCKLKASGNNIRLIVIPNSDPPHLCVIDPAFLQQILVNTLNNAIKYSPAHGKVEVIYSVSESEIKVQVTDHGPGIDPEKQLQIFDRFKKLDKSVNSINSGYGLGLSVSQALVELLGGTIEAQNNSEKGCTITVTFPNRKLSAQENQGNDNILFSDEELIF